MEHSQDLEADNTVSSIETSMSSVDYNNFIDTFDDYDVFESSVETVPDVPTKAEASSSFVEVDINSDTSNCTVTLDIFRKSDPQIVIPPQLIDIINCIASERSTLILNPLELSQFSHKMLSQLKLLFNAQQQKFLCDNFASEGSTSMSCKSTFNTSLTYQH